MIEFTSPGGLNPFWIPRIYEGLEILVFGDPNGFPG